MGFIRGLNMPKDVNFRIVEGAYNPNEYDTFIKLYNQGLTYIDIRNKMRIGHNRLRKLRKEALSNGDIAPKSRKIHINKNEKTYKEFVNLYNNRELTVAQIKKELKLNDYRYEIYRNHAAKNKDIQLRPIGRGGRNK